MKNVTGLDLVKLMAGSWGTLGFLTEVTFKVLPKPERTATLVLRGLDDAAPSTRHVGGARLALRGHRRGASAGRARQRRRRRTLLRLEGFAFSVDYRVGELRRALPARRPADIVDGETAAALWRGVRDVAPLAEPRDGRVWRISTAPTRGPASTARGARATPPRAGSTIGAAASSGSPARRRAMRAPPPSGRRDASHRRPRDPGPGAGERSGPRSTCSSRSRAAVAGCSRGIKARFDPAGIFNPGRMSCRALTAVARVPAMPRSRAVLAGRLVVARHDRGDGDSSAGRWAGCRSAPAAPCELWHGDVRSSENSQHLTRLVYASRTSSTASCSTPRSGCSAGSRGGRCRLGPGSCARARARRRLGDRREHDPG